MSAPVKAGERYKILIEDIGTGGEGIGHIDGFAVFVPKAIIGDITVIEIDKVNKKYAVGHMLSIVQPSPHRIKPPCPVSGQCGGCQIQAMAYAAQIVYKKKRVEASLLHIGKLNDVPVLDTLGMDEPWHYRNKAQLPIGIADNRPIIGFYAAGTHEIIDTDSCLIQHPIVDSVIKATKYYVAKYKIPLYDEKNGMGLIRNVMVRTGFSSGQVMVVPVINGDALPYADQYINTLQQNVNGLSTVVLSINKQRTNVILGSECKTLFGSGHIIDTLCGLEFKISPLSFFQVNPRQAEVLYNKAIEYAGLSGSQTVLDAYCGVGTISLIASKAAAKVYGIEEIPAAINDAKENALLNGIYNTEFICAKAEDAIERFTDAKARIDVAIVDPPRKGCDKRFLEALTNLSPERIVYVSCDPATLARDLSFLAQNGYKVQVAQPVDMFPHTVHVETVVLMSRKDTE